MQQQTTRDHGAASQRILSGTQSVWGGEEATLPQGATQVPVVHSVGFGYDDVDEWQQVALGQRVVLVKDTYGGTNLLFAEFLPRFNINVTLCDTTNHDQIEAEIAKGCDLVYLESPTNPTTKVLNIARLASHAGHEIACEQMRGFGGMLSFMLKENSFDAVRRFVPRMRFGHADANLGAVETTIGPPVTTSHVECTPEQRAAMGIPEGLIRYSTGIENVEDLQADLAQALRIFH
jgi:cystathionine beta-lyase/cystathionine gamma-synthase